MLLSISAITLFLDLFTICAYICGVDAANRVSNFTNYVEYALLAVRVVVWAVAAGLFKMASTGKTLWGYSCNVSDAVQNEVQSFLDFGKLCNAQVGQFTFPIEHVRTDALDRPVHGGPPSSKLLAIF